MNRCRDVTCKGTKISMYNLSSRYPQFDQTQFLFSISTQVIILKKIVSARPKSLCKFRFVLLSSKLSLISSARHWQSHKLWSWRNTIAWTHPPLQIGIARPGILSALLLTRGRSTTRWALSRCSTNYTAYDIDRGAVVCPLRYIKDSILKSGTGPGYWRR